MDILFTSLASVVDPVIILRLMLHKLSWDMGVVRDPRRKSVPALFIKSKSFDRRPQTSLEEGKKKLQIRRTSSLKNEKSLSLMKKDSKLAIDRTESSSSKKGLHKYLQNIFQRKKNRKRSSERSSGRSSDSEGIVEFQKELQNLPKYKIKPASKETEGATIHRSQTLQEESPRGVRRSFDSDRSDGSRARSPHRDSNESKIMPLHPLPQILVESRRVSVFSNYSYGYSLGSPDSEHLPLLTPPPAYSRRSSNSSASLSVHSSTGRSPSPSLASDGPFQYSFTLSNLRRRASTITGPVPKIKMVPPITAADPAAPRNVVVLKLLLINLLKVYGRTHPLLQTIISEASDFLNSASNIVSPDRKESTFAWCADICQTITMKVVSGKKDKFTSA